MGRLAIGIAILTVGCSSSTSLTCCFSFNGSATTWTCPNESANTQCCGGSDASGCGEDATPPNACTGTQVTSC